MPMGLRAPPTMEFIPRVAAMTPHSCQVAAMTLIAIDEALRDPNLLGATLGDLRTWSTWIAALKAAFGLKLTEAEAKTFGDIGGVVVSRQRRASVPSTPSLVAGPASHVWRRRCRSIAPYASTIGQAELRARRAIASVCHRPCGSRNLCSPTPRPSSRRHRSCGSKSCRSRRMRFWLKGNIPLRASLQTIGP